MEPVPPVTRFYEWECERFLGDQRRDVSWYRRLAAETRGPVLELGCGAGRIAVALAAAGHEVVGLDLQPHLLGRAERHAADAGVAGRCRFVVGDMRQLRLDRRYPLILLPYNTLGYLLREADVAECFAGVAAHLTPGGLFALQVTPFERGASPQPREFLAAGPYEDGELRMYESIGAEPERHLTHFDEEYQLRRPRRPVEVFRQRLTLRSYYRGDVRRMLLGAELEPRAVSGDFEGGPYPKPGYPAGPMLWEAVRAGGAR